MSDARLDGGVADPREPGPIRRYWALQRAGQWGLLVIVALGLLGLMGPGPLCEATVAGPDATWVRYPRFWRANASYELVIHVPPGAGRDGRARVWLDRDYLAGTSVSSIEPPPAGATLGPDGTVYAFAADAAGGDVRFTLRARRPALAYPHLRVNDAAPLAFTQVFWP